MAVREADTPEKDPGQSEQTQVRREHIVLEEEPKEPKKDPKPTKEPEKPIRAASPSKVTPTGQGSSVTSIKKQETESSRLFQSDLQQRQETVVTLLFLRS
ncbi:hypothetical protein MRB53_010350 [Persea americana]|uniref:Uncharacterized protein n=1 Tax=Persea americana TaxID=3435 RepID=A0ACC2LRR7_PERAE|nr:hypothetical protein MRB53_010350 [Persea americana]